MRWAILAFVLTLMNSPFAQANSCDCPGPIKDALSQPHCGPKPAALMHEAVSVENQSCPTCFYSGSPWLNPEMKRLNSDLRKRTDLPLEESDESSKNRNALNTYLNCNRENSKKDQARFCHFKDTLAPLIELAAKSAHQPFAVQACLFKRESDFSSSARSHAGAGGYIQFMPRTGRSVGTMADVNDILNESAEMMRGKLEKLEMHIEQLQREGSERSLLRNIAEHKGQFARYRARLVWDKYWEGTQNPPKHLLAEDVHCQNTAFVASLMKQTVDLFLMAPLSSTRHPEGEMPKIRNLDSRELGIFLAGAYNTSPSRFAKKCGSANSISECVGRIQNAETHHHLIALDHCSKPGNWMSLDPDDDSHQYKNLKCEETSKCSI